jgi:hypothetical protein
VEEFGRSLDEPKVILDIATLNERALAVLNRGAELQRLPVHKNMENNLPIIWMSKMGMKSFSNMTSSFFGSRVSKSSLITWKVWVSMCEKSSIEAYYLRYLGSLVTAQKSRYDRLLLAAND